MNMRVVFAIAAISILSMSALSTSADAKECYKLPWAERGECHRTDPAFPVRWTMCLALVDERGFKGSSLENKGVVDAFDACIHELSRLSVNELSRQTRLFGVEVKAWQPKRTASTQ
jgi:hypothetical protein